MTNINRLEFCQCKPQYYGRFCQSSIQPGMLQPSYSKESHTYKEWTFVSHLQKTKVIDFVVVHPILYILQISKLHIYTDNRLVNIRALSGRQTYVEGAFDSFNSQLLILLLNPVRIEVRNTHGLRQSSYDRFYGRTFWSNAATFAVDHKTVVIIIKSNNAFKARIEGTSLIFYDETILPEPLSNLVRSVCVQNDKVSGKVASFYNINVRQLTLYSKNHLISKKD